MENREFYYDFWFEEATDLVTKHDIQMKLCGKFCRACQGNLESQLTFEVIINSQCSNSGGHYSASWRKIPRSAPQSPHINKRIISSSTCQRSTVPTRIEWLTNPDTLWRFIPRGSSGKRGKDKVLLPTIYEALQLPDIYVFFLMLPYCLRSCGFFPGWRWRGSTNASITKHTPKHWLNRGQVTGLCERNS